MVAGPDAGKTTMIATIYELLHRGRLDGYRFAGSETLRGYEERCHLARIASNRETPDTPRTPRRAQLNFTHLRVATDAGIADLVFSDRSGEHFDTVLDYPTQIAEFAELARADAILLLVELDRLAATPHPCVSYLRRLVMAMSQCGLLEGKILRVVGTKADRLNSAALIERTTAALMDLAGDLTRRANCDVAIRPLVTASRRGPGNGGSGRGLKELLDDILAAEEPGSFRLSKIVPAQMTEMDALMVPYWDAQS
ncbi:hypothetical protein OMK73_15455 [Cupriavidus sp. D39]|nr:hypothetical protein [Cupriavidus sp. D39]